MLACVAVGVCFISARKLQSQAEEEGSKMAGMVMAMDSVMGTIR